MCLLLLLLTAATTAHEIRYQTHPHSESYVSRFYTMFDDNDRRINSNGPVLFPNDSPPPSKTPLIVTGRPLIESVTKSELSEITVKEYATETNPNLYQQRITENYNGTLADIKTSNNYLNIRYSDNDDVNPAGIQTIKEVYTQSKNNLDNIVKIDPCILDAERNSNNFRKSNNYLKMNNCNTSENINQYEKTTEFKANALLVKEDHQSDHNARQYPNLYLTKFDTFRPEKNPNIERALGRFDMQKNLPVNRRYWESRANSNRFKVFQVQEDFNDDFGFLRNFHAPTNNAYAQNDNSLATDIRDEYNVVDKHHGLPEYESRDKEYKIPDQEYRTIDSVYRIPETEFTQLNNIKNHDQGYKHQTIEYTIPEKGYKITEKEPRTIISEYRTFNKAFPTSDTIYRPSDSDKQYYKQFSNADNVYRPFEEHRQNDIVEYPKNNVHSNSDKENTYAKGYSAPNTLNKPIEYQRIDEKDFLAHNVEYKPVETTHVPTINELNKGHGSESPQSTYESPLELRPAYESRSPDPPQQYLTQIKQFVDEKQPEIVKKPQGDIAYHGFSNSELGKKYAFSYSVNDKTSGDDYSHIEKSTGTKTNGEYRVKLPDGRTQVVSYTADENGYNANVRYDYDDNNIDNEESTIAPIKSLNKAIFYRPGVKIETGAKEINGLKIGIEYKNNVNAKPIIVGYGKDNGNDDILNTIDRDRGIAYESKIVTAVPEQPTKQTLSPIPSSTPNPYTKLFEDYIVRIGNRKPFSHTTQNPYVSTKQRNVFF